MKRISLAIMLFVAVFAADLLAQSATDPQIDGTATSTETQSVTDASSDPTAPSSSQGGRVPEVAARVIGSPTDSGSVSLGSSPGTPARRRRPPCGKHEGPSRFFLDVDGPVRTDGPIGLLACASSLTRSGRCGGRAPPRPPHRPRYQGNVIAGGYSGSATRWSGSNSCSAGGSSATATWDLPLATARPPPKTARRSRLTTCSAWVSSSRMLARASVRRRRAAGEELRGAALSPRPRRWRRPRPGRAVRAATSCAAPAPP